MATTRPLASVTIPALLALTATCFGMSPMGSPLATVGEGQWTVGLGLGHQNTDLELSGTYQEVIAGSPSQTNPVTGDFDLKDFKTTSALARLAYGVNDRWDVFLLLGVADADGEAQLKGGPTGGANYIGAGERFAYDSGHNVAWGLGTRVTFETGPRISWGASAQLAWYDPSSSGASWNNPTQTDESLQADLDLQYWELQLAVGPTVRQGRWAWYGGPFLHLVDGDMDLSGTWADSGIPSSGTISGSLDVQQQSEVGAFLGAAYDINARTTGYIDALLTGDAWGIGVGAQWLLK